MADCDVIVIGAGLAGLACAIALADAGLRVTVLERGDEPGGRARSLTDPATGDRLDLGPHILLSEYRNLLALLDLFGTRERIAWQGRRFITLVDAPRATTLHVHPLPPPLHFLPDLLRVPQLSLADVASNVRVLWQVLRMDHARRLALDAVDAETCLRGLGVSARFLDWYWRTVAMAIMNVPLQACSAGALLGFFRYMVGRGGYAVGLPAVGLGDLFAPQAVARIQARGGSVRLGVAAERIAIGEGVAGATAREVVLAGGDVLRAPRIVAAVPPPSLLALLPEALRGAPVFRDLPAFAPSPYISSYLWFDRKLTDERFWAKVWSPDTLHYDFYDLSNLRAGWSARNSVIACNLIHSDRAAELDDAQVVAAARREIGEYLPRARRAGLRHAVVHRIPLAIPAPHPGSERLRPGPRAPVPGLYLAGDWTATGLPASMESATRSGWLAAEQLLADAGRPHAWAQPLPRMQGLAALVGGRAPAA